MCQYELYFCKIILRTIRCPIFVACIERSRKRDSRGDQWILQEGIGMGRGETRRGREEVLEERIGIEGHFRSNVEA